MINESLGAGTGWKSRCGLSYRVHDRMPDRSVRSEDVMVQGSDLVSGAQSLDVTLRTKKSCR